MSVDEKMASKNAIILHDKITSYDTFIAILYFMYKKLSTQFKQRGVSKLEYSLMLDQYFNLKNTPASIYINPDSEIPSDIKEQGVFNFEIKRLFALGIFTDPSVLFNSDSFIDPDFAKEQLLTLYSMVGISNLSLGSSLPFSNISSNSIYFNSIQLALANKLINPSSYLDIQRPVTKGDLPNIFIRTIAIQDKINALFMQN